MSLLTHSRLTGTVMAMLCEALAHAAVHTGQFANVAATGDAPLADRAAAQSLLSAASTGWCSEPPAAATTYPTSSRPAFSPSRSRFRVPLD